MPDGLSEQNLKFFECLLCCVRAYWANNILPGFLSGLLTGMPRWLIIAGPAADWALPVRPLKSTGCLLSLLGFPREYHWQTFKPSSANLLLLNLSESQNSLGYCFIGMDSERSEETPLLSSDRNLNNEEIYNRFTPARKRGILAIVSLTGLIPRTCISNISSSSYVVSLHNISFCLRNFHSCYTPNCRRPWLDGTHRKVKYSRLS